MNAKQTDKEQIQSLKTRIRLQSLMMIALSVMLVIVSVMLIMWSQKLGNSRKETNKLATQLTQRSYEAFAKEKVYTICNESRMSPSITEAECGRLQDLYNMEFLCEAANAQPDNKCWVETKSGIKLQSL